MSRHTATAIAVRELADQVDALRDDVREMIQDGLVALTDENQRMFEELSTLRREKELREATRTHG